MNNPFEKKFNGAIFFFVIVARYILKEHIGPFFFAFAVITLVLVMDFILEVMQSIITKGVGAWDVLEIFGLNLAWMLALSVPMSVLVATLMAYGRLASDSEILALKSGGWTWLKLSIPAILWGVLMAILMYLFNDRVLPESNYQARVKAAALAQKKPLLVLQPSVFNNQIPGYQIYMKEINPLTNAVSDVKIYQQTERGLPRTIFAPRGTVSLQQSRVTQNSSGLVFDLYEGEMAEADLKDPSQYRRVFFHRQKVSIKDADQSYFSGGDNYRGEREMNIQMMRERVKPLTEMAENYRQNLSGSVLQQINYRLLGHPPPGRSDSVGASPKINLWKEEELLARLRETAANLLAENGQINAYEVEIHKKYSLAAACLVFILIGAPLGAAVKKAGFGTAAGLSLGFFIFYWACLIGGEELADRGRITPFWAMWFANAFLTVIGLFLFYRMEKEGRLRLWERVTGRWKLLLERRRRAS